MAPKTQTVIKVKKIPLVSKGVDKPANFPDIHNLQLEFLENKEKLKDEYKDEPLPDPSRIQRELLFVDDDEEEEGRYIEDEPKSEEEEDEAEMEDELGLSEAESSGEEEESEGEKKVKTRPLTLKEKVELEKKEKEEYLVLFRVLRKRYPDDHDIIPEVDEYMSLEQLKNEYDKAVKLLCIDANVEYYRMFLVASFVVLEIAGSYINLPMGGFTLKQMEQMETYHSLLVELGAKHASSQESAWPVEARLGAMVIAQAVIFLLVNLVSANVSPGIGDLLSSVLTPKQSSKTAPVAKARMEPPSVSIDDLPDDEEEEVQEEEDIPLKKKTRRMR
jgi:hypothetical protein